jgi:hypothetical protein
MHRTRGVSAKVATNFVAAGTREIRANEGFGDEERRKRGGKVMMKHRLRRVAGWLHHAGCRLAGGAILSQ